ncbi:MAG: anthranilate phosphoribosyltransferase [Methanofollis sp.]|nr:anthranilate phosphoribosyltransferase [Methanofollis sp.]
MIADAVMKLVERRDLTAGEAGAVMREILSGSATQAQIGSFLTAMRMKGETVPEIAGCVQAMREASVSIAPGAASPLVDTCGTGGDLTGTFNISTIAAFVAAGAGVPVVKHGNRGVSSGCGSADVLAALGVGIDLPPARAQAVLEEIGIVFLYAPTYHPALRLAAGPRREIGIRTIFNLLGPLANPAGAQAQLVGVYAPELVTTVAGVLRDVGVARAMAVHGSGLDEISTTGPTNVAELKDGTILTYEIRCEDFGFRQAALHDLKGGNVAENAAIARSVLGGAAGAAREIVLLNAAAAIYLGGKSLTVADGVRVAERSIDSGRALEKLESLVTATGGAV